MWRLASKTSSRVGRAKRPETLRRLLNCCLAPLEVQEKAKDLAVGTQSGPEPKDQFARLPLVPLLTARGRGVVPQMFEIQQLTQACSVTPGTC